MKKQTADNFYLEVNKLSQAECDRLNADPRKLFGAVHHEFPDSMLSYYYQRGFTPQQAYNRIKAEARN